MIQVAWFNKTCFFFVISKFKFSKISEAVSNVTFVQTMKRSNILGFVIKGKEKDILDLNDRV